MTGPISAGAAMVLVGAGAGAVIDGAVGATLGAILAFIAATMLDEDA